MERIRIIVACLCMLAGTGCQPTADDSVKAQPAEQTDQESGEAVTDSKLAKRVGYLSVMVMQHPSVSDSDDYLELYDKQGKWLNQIVITFEEGVAAPDDRTRPIEITGELSHIDLGGPKGTKGEYANDAVHVKSWRYLDTKDVPRLDVDPLDELE